jgi:hypothetical protein
VIFSSTAQVRTNQSVTPNAIDENVFLDGSSNFDISANGSPSIGKGLSFPSTNLTEFQFIISDDFSDFPTALDGMIVYNVATGSTMETTPFGGIGQPLKADNGVVTSVSPGFYYFYNPIRLDEFLEPLPADTVEFGKWLPLGTGASGVVTVPVKSYNNLTETSTGISIDGKIVYAITGEFTTLGVNALITIAKPLGMTGYYKMTTYQNGRTFRSEISSFDIDPLVLTNNVVTGSGLFSEVYPLGTYTYTLEYFKS